MRPFLYTLDQIASMLAMPEERLFGFVYFDGRTVGPPKRDQLVARNLGSRGGFPDWRVVDRELVRWLKNRGIRIYERGWAQS